MLLTRELLDTDIGIVIQHYESGKTVREVIREAEAKFGFPELHIDFMSDLELDDYFNFLIDITKEED